MAKKSKKADLSSEEILDSLEKDVAENETVQAEEPEEPVVPHVEPHHHHTMDDMFRAWPVEKDHSSARDVLLGRGAGEAVDLGDDEYRSRTGINFVLLVLLLGVAAGGIFQLSRVSSAETLAAKKAARVAAEEAHAAEQLAKQKKYGILRIETTPAQATVFKDGEVLMHEDSAGAKIATLTPTNLMNLDIAESFKVKVEKAGYEPYEFSVAQHLWTKDSGSGEYKFFKLIELSPNICEYWFLYDAKKRKEMRFEGEEGKTECTTHYDEASQKGVSVTECTCKIPPEGWTPPEKKGDKKKKKGAKKGK